MLLEKEDISKDIKILLKSNEIKVIIMMLKLCDSLNMKIDKRRHFDIFDRLTDRYGIGLLLCLIKEKNVLDSNSKKKLMKYFHEFRLNDDEYKAMNSVIEDKETKRRIICIIMNY